MILESIQIIMFRKSFYYCFGILFVISFVHSFVNFIDNPFENSEIHNCNSWLNFQTNCNFPKIMWENLKMKLTNQLPKDLLIELSQKNNLKNTKNFLKNSQRNCPAFLISKKKKQKCHRFFFKHYQRNSQRNCRIPM